jgi:CRISPR type I-E-associated protein CasB/Cse2
MGETVETKPSQVERFLGHLADQAGDRGVMADLRHGLSRTTEYRAWPHIAPWCRLDDDRQRRIWLTVAAGFAIHQRTTSSGNMGTVLRALATGGGRGAEGLATFDARFRRLLACDSPAEVCDHLAGVLRAAERNAIAINFAQLFYDLQRWGDRVKVRWATQYWGVPIEESPGASSSQPDPSLAATDAGKDER